MSQTTVAIQTVSGGARRVPINDDGKIILPPGRGTSAAAALGYDLVAHTRRHREKSDRTSRKPPADKSAERVAERDGLTHGRRENRRLNRRTPPLRRLHLPSTVTRRHRYPAAKPCIIYETMRDSGGGDTATPSSGSLQEPLDRRRSSVKTPSVVARLFITINIHTHTHIADRCVVVVAAPDRPVVRP